MCRDLPASNRLPYFRADLSFENHQTRLGWPPITLFENWGFTSNLVKQRTSTTGIPVPCSLLLIGEKFTRARLWGRLVSSHDTGWAATVGSWTICRRQLHNCCNTKPAHILVCWSRGVASWAGDQGNCPVVNGSSSKFVQLGGGGGPCWDHYFPMGT